MSKVTLYDEKSISKLITLQKDNHWDLEKSIPWSDGINLDKYLIPLDDDAILFPGISLEQRKALSHLFGLVICASIFEMEETLLKLRKEAWVQFYESIPVSPEFVELGDLFFEEEQKHSQCFKRYSELYANTVGIDYQDLRDILPIIDQTKTEWILKQQLKRKGASFWWIVATVEQEFLLLYHSMKPHKEILDPLFFTLHKLHFEEEARHAPFPFLFIDLIKERNPTLLRPMFNRMDLGFAQALQTAWTLSSLKRLNKIKKLKLKHEWFADLEFIINEMNEKSRIKSIWTLMTSAPYLASLLNPNAHRKLVNYADRQGAWMLPFPEYQHKKLVNY